MLTRLMDLLSGEKKPALSGAVDVDVAVAALLVEAARMDDRFDAAERAEITRLLKSRFDLSEKDATDLLEQAHDRVQHDTQYFRFTHTITHSMSEEERAEVIEMLWRVVYADGVLDANEDALIRQISDLIGVSDRARMLARQKVVGKVK